MLSGKQLSKLNVFHTSFFSECFQHNHWQHFMDNLASGVGEDMSTEEVKTIQTKFMGLKFTLPLNLCVSSTRVVQKASV